MTRPVRFFFCLIPVLLSGLISVAHSETVAEPVIGHSGLPVPRFVNLKENKTWGRVGPSQTYPVRFEFTRKHLPVQVIAETRDNVWRKVRDVDGETMWIHHSKLTSSDHAMITRQDGVLLRAKPQIGAAARATIEYGVLAKVDECAPRWCQVTTGGYRGWVPRNTLWGVNDF
jgi:SH3-like domain-containing protein